MLVVVVVAVDEVVVVVGGLVVVDVVVVVTCVVEVVDEVLVDVVVLVEVEDDVVVVVVVGGALHSPALAAVKMDWISPAVRARLKISTSSMSPPKVALSSDPPIFRGAVFGCPRTPGTVLRSWPFM